MQTSESFFRTFQEPVYSSTDLEAMYERMVAKMLESFSAYLKKGSGWMLKRVLRLDITFSKNKPVKGSSYIPLPKGLKGSRSLIDVKNEKDNRCFQWSILRDFYPRADHKYRIEDLKEHVNEFNWDGIEFSTPCSEKMYKKFEENNNVSLLVFGHETSENTRNGKKVENIRIIPLYVSTKRHERVVRLFFFKNEEGNSHYCTITNLAGLVSRQIKSHNKGRGISFVTTV